MGRKGKKREGGVWVRDADMIGIDYLVGGRYEKRACCSRGDGYFWLDVSCTRYLGSGLLHSQLLCLGTASFPTP